MDMKNTIKEVWRPLYTFYQNYEFGAYRSSYNIRPNKYEVSNTGKVRNIVTKKEYTVDNKGRVTLDVNDFTYYGKAGRCQFPVKRLVYSTFVRPLKYDERVYFKKGNYCFVDNLIAK